VIPVKQVRARIQVIALSLGLTLGLTGLSGCARLGPKVLHLIAVPCPSSACITVGPGHGGTHGHGGGHGPAGHPKGKR
jgi:hypothetical protein